LELIAFNRAAAANSYEEARVSAEKARDIYPDGYDRDIEPKLLNMEAKRKISAILAKGAEALKNAQYSNVRRILDHLKGSYPEAAEMIRQSRYRENLAKGRAAQKKGDLKTAWALYKTAKAYAKTRAEHKQIDALIIAAAAGL
jgi:hypothetical protein